MPDSVLSAETLEQLRQRVPHLAAVNEHAGLETWARKLAHEEVLVHARADLSSVATAESQENPLDGELFIHSLTVAIEHSEAVLELESARIRWLTHARTVASEALTRAAILTP